MSPVGGAPVNAQPDKHNSKDQEDHLMVKLLMVNDQNTGDHNEYDSIKEKKITKQKAFWTQKTQWWRRRLI